MPFVMRHHISTHAIVLLVLAALTLVAFGPGIGTPSLFGDDWWQVLWGPQAGTLRCFSFSNPRPVADCSFMLAHTLAGTNIHAWHALKVLSIWAFAVLVYLTLAEMLPGKRLLAAVSACLFLVSPAVYSKSWLSGMGTSGYAMTVFIGGMLALLIFVRKGGWWRYALALFLLLFSFGIYEMQLGLAFCLPVLALLFQRSMPLRRKLGVLSASLVAVLYVFWRVWGQPAVGIVAGGYDVETLSLAPAYLITNIITGVRVLLQFSWAAAIVYYIPSLTTEGAHTFLASTLVLVTGMGVWLGVTALVVRRWQAGDEAHGADRWRALGFLLVVVAAGMAMIVAGYVPAVSFMPSWLDYANSRINLAASIGGAVVVSALLAVAAEWLHRNPRRQQITLVLLSIPLILIGTLAQFGVQRETASAWEQQKTVWQQLLVLAPNLADDTGVYIRMDATGQPLRLEAFLDGSWGFGFSSALRLLYANESLHGFAIIESVSPARYSASGIVRPWGTVPYDSIVLFDYNSATQQLRLLSEVPTEVLHGEQMTTPLGLQRILEGPAPESAYRHLVE